MIHKTVSFCSSYKCVVGVTKTHLHTCTRITLTVDTMDVSSNCESLYGPFGS